jgi:C4-dicarboxylate transporter DctQ subunit
MAAPSVARTLQLALQGAVGAVMVAAVLLNFANVVARYVFLSPIAAAEEILQLMNVWIVMLGAATITREHRHLQMDVVYQALPRGVRRLSDALTTTLTLLLTGYVIVQAFRVIGVLYATGTRSVAAGLPMAFMYAAMPLGFGCGALFLAQRLRGLAAERRAAPGANLP